MALSLFVVNSSCIAAAATSRRVSLSSKSILSRRPAVFVRCQSESEPVEDQSMKTTLSPQPKIATPPPQPIPTPAPKVSTKFSDVLAFSGPAPERINGRLAMLGFVAAMAVEVARGDGLFTQLTNGGLPWFVGTAVLFSAASLVPLFKGQKVEAKSDGLMNANAELWNGRFAMLGLVALAFTEYLTGGPLV